MKTVKLFLSAAGLAIFIVATTAFIDFQYDKKIKSLQQAKDQSGFAVVELFTSEGCSSCPPADQLMEKIQKDNKNKQLYLLAFHVDYWDHQGWRDRFSDHEFSLRQGQYASWMNLSTIYTPQVVVNGVTQMVGSDRGDVLGAISEGIKDTPAPTLRLHPHIQNSKLSVHYEGVERDKETELVLALVQKSAQSNVKRGENSGRLLSHVQIVRQLVRTNIEKEKNLILTLPEDFKAQDWELVGFVQRFSDGQIINAASTNFLAANMKE